MTDNAALGRCVRPKGGRTLSDAWSALSGRNRLKTLNSAMGKALQGVGMDLGSAPLGLGCATSALGVLSWAVIVATGVPASGTRVGARDP